MKTLLKIDGSLGQACGHLVKKLLVAAAPEVGLTLTETAADAELVVWVGVGEPTDAGLNGKRVFAGDAASAASQPAVFCHRRKPKPRCSRRQRAA